MKRIVLSALAVQTVIGTGQALAQAPPPRDSVVLDQLARTNPCPRQIPAAWTVSDSTVGNGGRCSLIAITARMLASSNDSIFRSVAARVVCVRIYAFDWITLPSRTSREANWTVEFVTADDGAGAQVDRFTGKFLLRRFPDEFGVGAAARCKPS